MGAGRKSKGQAKASAVTIPEPLGGEKDLSGAEEADSPQPESSVPVRGRKRSFHAVARAAEEEEEECFGGEMHSLLSSFGADISKSLDAKRKRLETVTQQSLKTSHKKVEEVWKSQQGERERLGDAYQKQVLAVMGQWESDIGKSRESEEKLQEMFRTQQKLFQQQRVVQSQRLKTIKQLHEQYMKSMEDLNRCHGDQQSSMQGELKKEMAQLQKKILMETQNQGMTNVRRSLQSMLAQV